MFVIALAPSQIRWYQATTTEEPAHAIDAAMQMAARCLISEPLHVRVLLGHARYRGRRYYRYSMNAS